MARQAFPKEGVATQCMQLVAPAEAAFTSRWRLSTLQRIDPDLHEAVVDQQRLYDVALLTGTDDEARHQAAAMVRGWKAACSRLEAPLQKDDAYFVGHHLQSGTKVVIGDHPASKARIQADPQHKGLNVIFITPDEVAALMAGLETVSAVKSLFPDAEILSRYPDEPHRADEGERL